MYLVLPAFRMRSRAGIDSSRGVSAPEHCQSPDERQHQGWAGRILTGVDSMEVIEIRGEAESFDGTLDIFLDMGRRVGHDSSSGRIVKDVEAAL